MKHTKFNIEKTCKRASRLFYFVIIAMVIAGFTGCFKEEEKPKIPTTTISGTVYFPNGSVREGVYIVLRQYISPVQSKPIQATSTNRNGEFQIVANVESGVYEIYAEINFVNGARYSQVFAFTIVAGQHHTVNFTIFEN